MLQEGEGKMPIFEYVCRGCGQRFERIVQGSHAPSCPTCRGTDLEQQLSVFAVGRPSGRSTAAPAACGACGDPRGPGSCSLD